MTVFSNSMLMRSVARPLEFVSASSVGVTSSDTMTVAKPSGVVAGMHLIAIGFAATSTLLGTLSGWTLVYDGTGGGAPDIAIYRKIAGGSEPSSYSWTGGSNPRNCHILAYQGGQGLVNLAGTKTVASSATSTAGSITPTLPGILISAFGIAGAARTVSSPPSGMTQRSYNGANMSSAIYGLAPSPAGATGDKTLVWLGGAANSGGVSLQIC